jgi:acetyl esterase/lipase
MKLTMCFLVSGLLAPLIVRAADPSVIPLWAHGAPGFESRRNEPEQARDYWVKNIHNPSVTVFVPPKEKATGAAVVVFPGGGHRELVFNAEGVDAAKYLNSIGIAALVVKYRLAREPDSPYQLERDAGADGRRAVRLVRSRAAEWGIDPKRIGVLGFSAGGEVVSWIVYQPTAGDPNAPDLIDRQSARPDFQVVIYPGPLGVPAKIAPDTPPAFFLAAQDDTGAGDVISDLLPKYRAAHVPIEVHLYARGGHAFNMGQRATLVTLKTWPQRMADWMADNGILRLQSN